MPSKGREAVYGDCKYGKLAVQYARPVCSRGDKQRRDPEMCNAHYELIERMRRAPKNRSRMEGSGK